MTKKRKKSIPPPANSFDPEKLRNYLREQKEKQEEAERKRKIPQIVGNCFVCDGEVSEIKVPNYGLRGPTIGGPPVPLKVVGYYCKNCGLKYHNIPPKKEKIRSK
jgi:hypothetical protein